MASACGDRDPLLLPAGELVGVRGAVLPHADAGEQWLRALERLGLGELQHLARPERHVLEHGHVGEEVVGLEHDADLAPQHVEGGVVLDDEPTVDADLALLDGLEPVDAAQQRGLPGAGRSDEAHNLVLGDLEVDALEHDEVAEALLDVVHLDEGRLRRHPLARMRRWSRSTSQSVNRVSGIVITTKQIPSPVTDERLKWFPA